MALKSRSIVAARSLAWRPGVASVGCSNGGTAPAAEMTKVIQDRLQPAAHRQRQGADRHDRQRHQDGPGRSRLQGRRLHDRVRRLGRRHRRRRPVDGRSAKRANANEAVKDPDVMVYIGTYNSGAAKISMPILNKAGLLMISPANTWPGLTKPGMGDPGEPEIYRPSGKVNYFRVVPADDLQGPLARRLGQGDGGRSGSTSSTTTKSTAAASPSCSSERAAGDRHRSAGPREHRRQEPGIQVADDDASKATNPDLVYFGGTTQTQGGPDRQGHGRGRPGLPSSWCPTAASKRRSSSRPAPRTSTTAASSPSAACRPSKLEGAGQGVRREVQGQVRQRAGGLRHLWLRSRPRSPSKRFARPARRTARRSSKRAWRSRTSTGALGKWSFDENGDTTMRVDQRQHGRRTASSSSSGSSGQAAECQPSPRLRQCRPMPTELFGAFRTAEFRYVTSLMPILLAAAGDPGRPGSSLSSTA